LAGKPLDSEYVRSLENCIAGLGVGDRVHFLGGVTDVPALLRETDVFVLSTVSKGEGCPVALLEAMSSGRACVASRVSGCIDVIQHGANGLLVEPENVTALADALRELCSSLELRRDLGRQARRRIETDYTMEREAAQYDSLYRSALGFTG
jgi:glycosyltransferase involved in cell wall biosynthesis